MADRISALPISVLCHIISFLPTKEAIATNVLSKRWNPLWRSVPTLDFDFDDESYAYELTKEKCSCFVQWVNEVIISRDLHQPIQTFRLRCLSFHCDPIKVKIWVNAAIQRRVEHLDLTQHELFAWSCRLNMKLPSAIFRHRILVVLKLTGLALKPILSIDLPSLKILHLDEVRFLESRYLAELLFGCPVLEDLVIKFMYFDISYPRSLTDRDFKRLPKLIRADIHKRYVPLLILNNIEFLSIDKGLPFFFVICDQGTDMKNGDDPNPYAEDLIPVFHNLVHIELTYFYCTMNWLDVIEVLSHCPKLQILVINQNFRYARDYEEIDWRYPHSVPKCISLHLKTCHLNDYRGSKSEVRFARYVMRNASFLRTMKICANAQNIRDKELNKFEMLKELSSCTRCSPTCELSFEII